MSGSDLTERTDALGRKLSIRALTLLEQIDLMEAVGNASANVRWWSTAMTACAIRNIDGRPVPMAANRNQVREHIEMVQQAGFDAAQRVLFPEAFADEDPGNAGKTKKDEGVAAAGN